MIKKKDWSETDEICCSCRCACVQVAEFCVAETLQQSDTEKATRNEQLSMLPVALPTDPQVGWQLGCLPMASYAGAMQGPKKREAELRNALPVSAGLT